MVSGENANKKKTLVEWNEECQEAFKKLKHYAAKLLSWLMPIIRNLSNCITDASENGLGAVLYQKQDDGMDHFIAYASQTL